MKERLLTQILVLSVGFILLSAIVPVNASAQPVTQHSFTPAIDGVPLPPPVDPSVQPSNGWGIDGVPLPPPVDPRA